MTAASMDDFARYCCGDPDCSNDCERETPPLTSEDYRRAANDMAEKLPDDSHAALTPGSRISGTFAPRRTDDLKPGVEKWIGWNGEWEVFWLITEDDGDSYVGEYAVGCPRDVDEWQARAPYPAVWVPSGDIDEADPDA